MKNYIAIIAATVALMIVICGTDSLAQSPARVVASIPFEFSVGSKTLPAGRYEFETANRQAYPGSLVIRSMGSTEKRSLVVTALASDPAGASDRIGLVFSRYGDRYFLSKIGLGASDLAVRFGKTPAERTLAKQQQQRPVAVLIRPSTRH